MRSRTASAPRGCSETHDPAPRLLPRHTSLAQLDSALVLDDATYLTVAEVAALLRLNQQTLRNWIDAGELPALRVGRRVRIRRSDLDELLEAGSTSSATIRTQLDGVEQEARERVAVELGRARRATLGRDDAKLAAALNLLAEAASDLALALDNSHDDSRETDHAS